MNLSQYASKMSKNSSCKKVFNLLLFILADFTKMLQYPTVVVFPDGWTWDRVGQWSEVSFLLLCRNRRHYCSKVLVKHTPVSRDMIGQYHWTYKLFTWAYSVHLGIQTVQLGIQCSLGHTNSSFLAYKLFSPVVEQ